jgi:Rrf2 family iron-sulfur cluster assembly transcriptional regulator
MKISSKARYAIQSMLQLALSPEGRPVTLSQLTRQQGISPSYLEQLLAGLRGQKLVCGVRGPGGGYRLARAVDNISIEDIIVAVHEEHVTRPPKSQHEDSLYNDMWWDLSERLQSFLTGISLADLMAREDVQRCLHEQRLLKGRPPETMTAHSRYSA